jgi:hypothetical protein
VISVRDVSFRKLMYEWVVVAMGGDISVVLGHVGVSTSVFTIVVDCVCVCDRFGRGGAVSLCSRGLRCVTGGVVVS